MTGSSIKSPSVPLYERGRKFSAIVCALLLLAGCAGGFKVPFWKDQAETSASPVVKVPAVPPPDWALGKGHPRYSRDLYLVGVGFSDKNPASAQDLARSDLAKELKVEIKSKSKDFESTQGSYIESIVETEVKAILEGVIIKDGWHDSTSGNFYAFAVLERSLAADTVRERIKSSESALNGYMTEGAEAEGKGNLVGALSNYLSGYQRASSLLPLYGALRVIVRSSDPAKGPQNLGDGDFKSRVQEIVRKIRIETVSGDRQVVKKQQGLAEPLAARVFLQTESGAAPVGNIPVVFRYEKGAGEVETEKTSDADGMVRAAVHKISSFEEANHVVTAKLDYPKLLASLDRETAEAAAKLLAPLENVKASFGYTINVPKWDSSKSQGWKNGITDLVNQIIKNLAPGIKPVVGVVDFKDQRYGGSAPFSRILKDDVKTVLVQAEDLQVREINTPPESREKPEEIAKAQKLEFYVTGSYRMEKDGLEIRAFLVETRTGTIKSSANTQIKRQEMHPDDLAVLEKYRPSADYQTTQADEAYQQNLENLYFLKPERPAFNVKVWTEQTDYQIGRNIVFNVKSEKDCYLTLLDIGSSGNVTVIFPNAYHKDNFIKAGVTYPIPAPDYGFKFDVQGPTGLEKIKAIATLKPGMPLNLNMDKGFHTMVRGSERGTRDIRVLTDKFTGKDATGWAEAGFEIFIFEKGETYFRGSRKIPLVEKPKKPIDMIGTFGNEEGKKE